MNESSNQPALLPEGLYEHQEYSDRELANRRIGKVEARKLAGRKFLAGIAIGAVGLTGAVVGSKYVEGRLDNQAEATRSAQQPIEQQAQTIDQNNAVEASQNQ